MAPIKIPAPTLELLKGKPYELMVYAYLLAYPGTYHGSLGDLAWDTQISERKIKYVLKELLALGMVQRIKQRGKTDLYWAVADANQWQKASEAQAA